jgi:hypothetical protein
MKATIDLPDDLYRRVKAKSALQGQAVREVAIGLFQGWIAEKTPAPEEAQIRAAQRSPPAWFAGAREYARQVRRHDMATVRRSIARGRAREAKAVRS